MPDSIVSVRVPQQLHDDLKQVAAEQYYMDLSEAVRSLVRKKLAEKTGEDKTAKELIDGLQNLLRRIEGGAGE